MEKIPLRQSIWHFKILLKYVSSCGDLHFLLYVVSTSLHVDWQNCISDKMKMASLEYNGLTDIARLQLLVLYLLK